MKFAFAFVTLSALVAQVRCIVGGQMAIAGQIPHQVFITADVVFQFGGSLISKRWILTAAHCLHDRNNFVVQMGSLTWNGEIDPNRVIMTTAIRIPHPEYNDVNLANDIGLIQLPQDAPINAYIKPVALPTQFDVGKLFAAVQATASGWGLRRDGGEMSRNLLWAKFNIISNSVCARTFGHIIFIQSTICTSGSGQKSHCNGDSGGPLTIKNGDLVKQIGILSRVSEDGCDHADPQVSTRVTLYLDWIHQTTGITIKKNDNEF